MEFPFDINSILPYEITILNGDFRILNHGQTARVGGSDKLNMIIDHVGEASFKAQGLPCPVTTGRKFRISDHRLYLMKNGSDHNNLGSVVGLLKVGEKHLYIYDSNGQVHERTPLCLLDFYVHESKQRSGYGKKLFDTMLEFEKCQAHELAIDRPSSKCLAFLHKHFHLSAPIRQVNNFVVYNGFFNRPSLAQNRRSSASRSQQEKNHNARPLEHNSWSILAEKTASRRPFSEQNDSQRVQRIRSISSDVSEPSSVHRRTNNEQVQTQSAAPNSYAYAFSQNSLLKDPFKSNSIGHSASQVPRNYSEILNENNPFPSLQRYHTNPSLLSTKPLTAHLTYKDYQSSSALNEPRRKLESAPTNDEPLTSIYTFPSLMKTNPRWQKTSSQPSVSDASSSAWRLFGIGRLTN